MNRSKATEQSTRIVKLSIHRDSWTVVDIVQFVLDVRRRRISSLSAVVITGSRYVCQRKLGLAARSLTDAVGGRTNLASCLFGSHVSTDGAFL
jgi:hypothetical protein